MSSTSIYLSDEPSGFTETHVNIRHFETSFRRWLVAEIDSGRLSLAEAIKRFNLPKRFDQNFRFWQRTYSEEFHLSLGTMSSKELSDNKELAKRINELERQLEKAQMKNVALNTLIDIAEKELKVPIRKKPGSKQ